MDLSETKRRRRSRCTASTTRIGNTQAVRPAVPARAAARRARRAVHRTDLSRAATAIAGTSTAASSTATQNNARTVDQADRRPAEGSEGSAACSNETLVVWSRRIRPHAVRPGPTAATTTRSASRIWMAGGGIKGGTIYGATDEFGYQAVEGKTEIHDLHATMLHLLRHRPHAADLPLRRPRHAADRRAWEGCHRSARLIGGTFDKDGIFRLFPTLRPLSHARYWQRPMWCCVNMLRGIVT